MCYAIYDYVSCYSKYSKLNKSAQSLFKLTKNATFDSSQIWGSMLLSIKIWLPLLFEKVRLKNFIVRHYPGHNQECIALNDGVK